LKSTLTNKSSMHDTVSAIGEAEAVPK